MNKRKQKGVFDIAMAIGLAVFVVLQIGQYERVKQDERHQADMVELRSAQPESKPETQDTE